MAVSLFSSTGETAHLHRLIARLTLAGAAFSAVLLAVVALVSGRTSFLIEAVGPTMTALFLLPMVLRRRENAAVTFVLASAAVIITFKLVGTDDTIVAAVVAIVLMGCLAILFVTRHTIPFILAAAAVLAGVPVFWSGRLEGSLALGLVASLAFVVGAIAILMVRNAAGEVNSRFRLAFEDAPVALIELDWTEALDYLEQHLADLDIATVFDREPDLLRAVVSRTRSLRANAEAANVFDAESPADLVGYPGSAFARGPIGDWWRHQVVSILKGETLTETTVSLAETGVDRWVAVRTITSRGSDGRTTSVVAMTDVTPAKLHERSLKELIDAKDEFIATVSHELRTPLTAVVGLATELSEGSYLGDAERLELAKIVAGQSREISYIVEDLLVGARADIGTVSVMSEDVDVIEAANGLRGELEWDGEVETSGGGLVVLGDTVRIRQILRNLLVNAQRYGGENCRVVARRDVEVAVIEVRDSGKAIPEGMRERIFLPYESAHDRKGVTLAMGLGLSVSRRLARLMGGDLVYFHDGEAVFRLTLPLASSAPQPVDAESVAAAG